MTSTEPTPSSAAGSEANVPASTHDWGGNHAHDPTAVLADDGTYWLFSTDANADGALPGAGAQMRRSRDLVTWEFVGWALPGVPKPARDWSGAQGLWAPDVAMVNTPTGREWRMYYSASTFGSRTSAIGLAVAPEPAGPWSDRGIVVATQHDRDGHNAIDAQLIIDDQRHHLVYGSFFGGIHVLEIDPVTGFALDAPAPGEPAQSFGVLIARRPPSVDTAIEGPYVIPRPGGGWALIVSFDSLASTYHVRVGVADEVAGPYFDAAGNEFTDLDAPPERVGLTVLASHQLDGARGLLAPGHASVLTEPGRQLLVHHTRFPDNPSQHEVQVRRLVWTHGGWPLVAVQPWAGDLEVDDETRWPDDTAALTGTWEVIDWSGPTGRVARSHHVEVTTASLNGLVAHGKGRFTRPDGVSQDPSDAVEAVDAVVFPAWDAVRGIATLSFAARVGHDRVVVGTRVVDRVRGIAGVGSVG